MFSSIAYVLKLSQRRLPIYTLALETIMQRGVKFYLLQLLHWFIIINFAVEIIYANYMIFSVFSPPEAGPLFDRAADFPFEMMVTRRLYAVEAWLAIVGLAIYLAITEIKPRLHRESET